MAGLPYGKYYATLWKNVPLSDDQVLKLINAKWGRYRAVTLRQLREFKLGRSCPSAALAQVIATTFKQQNISPLAYGWGNHDKPRKRGVKR